MAEEVCGAGGLVTSLLVQARPAMDLICEAQTWG